ncbi:hypothetical protein PSU4_51500 [Pseudonocardia sulfidoxydans NBRC 16205]|uniref:GH16 domain-containing protein n=1 Tax=Pseudonocardia sulfidoxydans NBRC 16205 TaxID=1223511 RepID=A0A511DN00_9PSEU|nr:hypothetical protein [Pseudonocardia sulfidoxydans]GEL26196.1 hypothetical protein PSU4_51500 [Pseudonocardia sulfidoxydans NBRC 16205]
MSAIDLVGLIQRAVSAGVTGVLLSVGHLAPAPVDPLPRAEDSRSALPWETAPWDGMPWDGTPWDTTQSGTPQPGTPQPGTPQPGTPSTDPLPAGPLQWDPPPADPPPGEPPIAEPPIAEPPPFDPPPGEPPIAEPLVAEPPRIEPPPADLPPVTPPVVRTPTAPPPADPLATGPRPRDPRPTDPPPTDPPPTDLRPTDPPPTDPPIVQARTPDPAPRKTTRPMPRTLPDTRAEPTRATTTTARDAPIRSEEFDTVPPARDLRSAGRTSVRDGVLTLSGAGASCWTGARTSGRWDVRMRVPAAAGAVLLAGADARAGEIRFADLDGTRASYVVRGVEGTTSGSTTVDTRGWHVWSVEWTPAAVVGLVDGKEWFRADNPAVRGPLFLCLQARGAATLQVDHVREYASRT